MGSDRPCSQAAPSSKRSIAANAAIDDCKQKVCLSTWMKMNKYTYRYRVRKNNNNV